VAVLTPTSGEQVHRKGFTVQYASQNPLSMYLTLLDAQVQADCDASLPTQALTTGGTLSCSSSIIAAGEGKIQLMGRDDHVVPNTAFQEVDIGRSITTEVAVIWV